MCLIKCLYVKIVPVCESLLLWSDVGIFQPPLVPLAGCPCVVIHICIYIYIFIRKCFKNTLNILEDLFSSSFCHLKIILVHLENTTLYNVSLLFLLFLLAKNLVSYCFFYAVYVIIQHETLNPQIFKSLKYFTLNIGNVWKVRLFILTCKTLLY